MGGLSSSPGLCCSRTADRCPSTVSAGVPVGKQQSIIPKQPPPMKSFKNHGNAKRDVRARTQMIAKEKRVSKHKPPRSAFDVVYLAESYEDSIDSIKKHHDDMQEKVRLRSAFKLVGPSPSSQAINPV